MERSEELTLLVIFRLREGSNHTTVHHRENSNAWKILLIRSQLKYSKWSGLVG